MKWAHIVDDRIDTISYDEVSGWVEVADTVFGGFVRDGTGWASPPATPAQKIWLRVTARQFKLALLNAGLFDQADSIAMNHPYKGVQIEWLNASEFSEDSSTLRAMIMELNKTDDEMHALMQAATLL